LIIFATSCIHSAYKINCKQSNGRIFVLKSDVMPEAKLTNKTVEGLLFPEAGQVIYWDTILPGFGIRITSKAKAYICQRRVNRRTVRVTNGRADQITPDQARRLAQDHLYRMIQDEDINQRKRGTECEAVTLDQAYKEFLAIRELKTSTLRDYDWLLSNVFDDWKRTPAIDITRNMVQRRHRRTGEKRGAAHANRAARFLRSLLNFCAGGYENREGKPLLTDNPVKVLSQTRAWFRVDRRRTIIKPLQLKPWFETVQECPNTTVKDFLLFVLFTGTRKGEAQSLKWENINFQEKTITFPETKNRKPLDLPLSKFLAGLLKSRKEKAGSSPFVFHGKSRAGHLSEPKKVIAEIAKKSGVSFCIHDLRRTFITTAESMDISVYSVKLLVNHSTGNDVTAGFVVTDVERLRASMEKISDRILKLCRGEIGKIIIMPGISEGDLLCQS
jgi:integrase